MWKFSVIWFVIPIYCVCRNWLWMEIIVEPSLNWQWKVIFIRIFKSWWQWMRILRLWFDIWRTILGLTWKNDWRFQAFVLLKFQQTLRWISWNFGLSLSFGKDGILRIFLKRSLQIIMHCWYLTSCVIEIPVWIKTGNLIRKVLVQDIRMLIWLQLCRPKSVYCFNWPMR